MRSHISIPSWFSLLPVLTGLAWSASASTSAQLGGTLHEQVDALVHAHMDSASIVGLSVAIVRGDEALLTKGYGLQELGSDRAVDEHTAFLTCSITKLFTATAVMGLVEQGRLRLADRVVDHLPEFRLKDERYDRITIEHLLTHSSGLPWDHALKNAPQDSTALGALVRSMARSVRLQFAPGERFDGETYSNAGFDLLGYLVERVSGMSFARYVQENVLSVAGMTDSGFGTPPKKGERAEPYAVAGNSRAVKQLNLYGIDDSDRPSLNGGPLQLRMMEQPAAPVEQYPCGYLYSTAADLTNWMAHLLHIQADSLFAPPAAVLQRATLARMWATRRTIEGKRTAMGLCWWNYNDPDLGRYVFHVGRDPGYSTILLILPEEHIGVAVLCNGMYADDTVWNRLAPGIAKLVKEQGGKF